MSKVRISEKGKALLKNKYLSSIVSKAIANDKGKLYTKEGLSIEVDGKTIVLRGV